jgi:HD-GYP domain-containing protein (c-di-GMP phosphodiesterase class II)
MSNRVDVIRNMLRNTPLLSAVPDDLLHQFAERAVEKRFRRGEFILRDGDLSNSMYIIVQGEVDIIKDVHDQESLRSHFGPGEPFGEMALIDDSPRSAHVRAASDELVVLEFSKDDVLSLLLSHPKTLYAVMKVLNSRFRVANDERRREQEQKIDELSEINRQLQKANNDILLVLMRALDERDHATEGHSQRVTAYSLLMGEVLGLDAEALESLRRGAQLHDIGKIGVSDNILHKSDLLTDEDWRKMRDHPAKGKGIIADIDYLACAQDVVYSHHEHWDGMGYPQELHGEQIPLGARIFAVADVFDALTMKRSYKDEWSPEAACDQIIRESGTHFDPEVVEAFVKAFPQIVDELTRWKAEHKVHPIANRGVARTDNVL